NETSARCSRARRARHRPRRTKYTLACHRSFRPHGTVRCTGRRPQQSCAVRLSTTSSAIAPRLDVFGIPSPLDGDLGGGAFNLSEIIRCKFHGGCCDVFFKAMELGRPWNWNYPWLLCQQPGERDLTGCSLLALRDLGKKIHQYSICLPVLRVESRHGAAEIRVIDLRRLVDLARQITLAQRAKWNEPDSKFLKRRQHFLLRLAIPQRVFTLHRSDRLNRVCATDRLCCCFRHAEVLHLALPNKVLHDSRHFFDRNLGVHPVLIVKIDGIDPEPLE